MSKTPLDELAAALSRRGLRAIDVGLEQGPSVTVSDGSSSVLLELARRDDAGETYARTERFDVSVRPAIPGDGLDAHGRVLADRAIEVLREWERALSMPERAARASEVREVRPERGLVVEGEGRYHLNPYVGCTIGCPYCWVADRADLGRFFAGRAEVPWGRWVDVKVGLPDVLRAEVLRLSPGPVRMSPVVTDPYQPLERRHRLSRACIELLAAARFSPIVLTRARRVLDDLPLFARFPDRIAVGLSIPTDDDAVRRSFERAADPIEDRLATLRALRMAGVTTFAVVQPVLPMSPERLIDAIAPHVDAVRIDRMHEVRRALPIYERAGCPEAAGRGFADDLCARLTDGFRARGVPIDERDDLASLVLGALGRRA